MFDKYATIKTQCEAERDDERIVTKSQWAPFFRICLIGFLARLGYQMGRSPVLPRFGQELGAGPEFIGWIVAASTITGIFVKLPAGVLSDIFGRRKMLMLSSFFFAFPPLLYPFVHTPAQLLVLRFFHGFSTAIFGPVASAYVADLFDKDRGEKLGWFAAASEFGSTIGPLLGGIVLYLSSSFVVAYAGVALLGVWPFWVLWKMRSDGGPLSNGRKENPSFGEANQLFMKGVREITQHRPILIASTMEACLFLGIGALAGFLPLYAWQHGMNEAQIGMLLGVQLVTAMAGKPLTGKLSDRIGRKPMIVFGLLLCALILPCLTLLTSFWLLLALCFFFGLGMAIVTPSTTALVADLCHNGQYGSAMGVFGTIWDVGEASGPILAGLLIGAWGYFVSFSILALLMTIGAVLFALFVPDPSVSLSSIEVSSDGLACENVIEAQKKRSAFHNTERF